MVDEITCFEISPGSIRIEQCADCGNEAFTFTAVALNAKGVAPVGIIRRCYNCEK